MARVKREGWVAVVKLILFFTHPLRPPHPTAVKPMKVKVAAEAAESGKKH